MKHIAIFSNSGAAQTALSVGKLENPYVAEVSGALDYNTLRPLPVLTDSDGNVYTTVNSAETIFDFVANMDVDATWTLLDNAQPVTASTFTLDVYLVCGGEPNWDTTLTLQNLSLENFKYDDYTGSMPPYDQPNMQVTLGYDRELGTVEGNVMYYATECPGPSSSE